MSQSSGNGEVMSKQNESRFSASIVCVQPDFDELMRRFMGRVDPSFRGARFSPIERRKGASMEKRDVTFDYVHMGQSASTAQALAHMDHCNRLPALYEEFLGFAEKYPDELRKYPIAALGSVTGERDSSRIAYLWDDGGDLILRLTEIPDGWYGGLWIDVCRFLVTVPD